MTKKRLLVEDCEVTKGFYTTDTKIHGDGEEATTIREPFALFVCGRGKFGAMQALCDRSRIEDPLNWWTINGDRASVLKALATRLLAQVASSSSSERNWSTHGYIHSMKKN